MTYASWFGGWAIAAASIGAMPAVAAPIALLPGGGGLSGSFVQSSSGLFIDTFDFTPGSVSGLVSVVLQNVSGPASFFTASLNDQNFSFFPELGAANFAFNATVTAAAPLSLTVFGAFLDADGNPTGSGSYRGTVNVAVAAVPEPATVAMLLGGLGLMGFALRRRLDGGGPPSRFAVETSAG